MVRCTRSDEGAQRASNHGPEKYLGYCPTERSFLPPSVILLRMHGSRLAPRAIALRTRTLFYDICKGVLMYGVPRLITAKRRWMILQRTALMTAMGGLPSASFRW